MEFICANCWSYHDGDCEPASVAEVDRVIASQTAEVDRIVSEFEAANQ